MFRIPNICEIIFICGVCVQYVSGWSVMPNQKRYRGKGARKEQSTCLLRYKLFDDRMKIRWNKIPQEVVVERVEYIRPKNGVYISSLLTRHFVASGNNSHATHAMSHQHSIQFTQTANTRTQKWSDNKVNVAVVLKLETRVWCWCERKADTIIVYREIDWPLTAHTQRHTRIWGQLRNNDDMLLCC